MMTPELVLTEVQGAMRVALLVAGPLLLIELIVGVLVGLLQAVTQVQEQSISFVAKLMALIITIAIAGPWMLALLVEYTRSLIGRIPGLLV
jgi:flagellar biosynthetic protein FliQ